MTDRSSGSRCRRSGRSPPVPSTRSSIPRSSGTSGREPLAALALAGTVVNAAVSIADFLSYGTTAQIARLTAAGETGAATRRRRPGAVARARDGDRRAARCCSSCRQPADRGHRPRRRRPRRRPSSTSLIVAPGGARAADRARGRGMPARTRRPAQSAADPDRRQRASTSCSRSSFVYGLHLGLAGSALGTLIAQFGMGAAFARRMLDDLGRRSGGPNSRGCGRCCGRAATSRFGRSLCSERSRSSSALAARFGTASLAAHQVGFRAVHLPRARPRLDRDRRPDPDRAAARRGRRARPPARRAAG